MTRSADAQLQQAVKRFEDFHGFAPGPNQVGAIMQDAPAAGLVVGQLDGVIYRALGERKGYIHRFAPKARPTLAVSYDGKQGYMVGGNYKFTDRGFEDRPKGTREMAGSILVVNPKPKRRKKKAHTRKAVRRRKAATRSPTSRKTEKEPMAKRKHRRRKSHRRASRGRVANFHKNPRRRFGRARAALTRRRGLGGAGDRSTGLMGMVMPAAIGAAGAWGVEYLFTNYISAQLPATMQEGTAGAAMVKAAIAVGVGYGVSKVSDKRTGALIAAGALTVIAYNFITDMTAAAAPAADDGTGTGADDPTAGGATNTAALQRYLARKRMAGLAYHSPGRVASGVGRYVAA